MEDKERTIKKQQFGQANIDGAINSLMTLCPVKEWDKRDSNAMLKLF